MKPPELEAKPLLMCSGIPTISCSLKQAIKKHCADHASMTKPTKTPPKAASQIDWEKIERLYRAGSLSTSEIGRQHGVTRQAIEKRAKKQHWKKDLSTRFRQEVAARLVANEVAEKSRTQPATEQSIIDEAASVAVELVRQHRNDIGKARGIGNLLFDQLMEACHSRPELEQAIEDDASEQLESSASANSGVVPRDEYQRIQAKKAMWLRAVSLPAHAGVLRDLAMATKHLIGLEREAFGLTDGDGDKPQSDAPAVAYDVAFGI